VAFQNETELDLVPCIEQALTETLRWRVTGPDVSLLRVSLTDAWQIVRPDRNTASVDGQPRPQNKPRPKGYAPAVVSVRLDADTVRKLDQLSERTGRSRGFYIRTAILEMLPQLEADYWAHEAITRVQREDREFGSIIASLNNES